MKKKRTTYILPTITVWISLLLTGCVQNVSTYSEYDDQYAESGNNDLLYSHTNNKKNNTLYNHNYNLAHDNDYSYLPYQPYNTSDQEEYYYTETYTEPQSKYSYNDNDAEYQEYKAPTTSGSAYLGYTDDFDNTYIKYKKPQQQTNTTTSQYSDNDSDYYPLYTYDAKGNITNQDNDKGVYKPFSTNNTIPYIEPPQVEADKVATDFYDYQY